MSSSTHTMENYSFSKFCSFVCSFVFNNQVSSDHVVIESGVIKELRIRKNKFEEQLQLEKWTTEYMDTPHGLFLPDKIAENPVLFLKFCYFQELQLTGYINISIRQFDEPSLLQKCRDARIDGYSALGAAMLAKEVQDPCKGGFIFDLKDRGYTLTEKDKELLVLELYDRIPVQHKKIMILLLCNQQTSDELPHDIRNYIVHYMIDALKKDYPSVMDMGKHHLKMCTATFGSNNHIDIVQLLIRAHADGAQ